MQASSKSVVANLTRRMLKFEPWRAGRGALILYLLVIIYASLNPFIGWHRPESIGLFTWPRYIVWFDVVLNIVAYAPLGALIAAILRRHLERNQGATAVAPHPAPAAWAWLAAVLASAALSALLELMQSMLPGRVSSALDWLANSCGAVLGAMAVTVAPGRAVLAKIEYWRHRLFAPGSHAEWGLLLLALWFFAQLNPAIPFFEAGKVINPQLSVENSPQPYDPLYLLPQAAGITFNVCGFALLVSLVMARGRRVWLTVTLTLMVGFMAKVSMAALMLKAPQLIGWMSPGTVIGLSAGLALSIFLLPLTYRRRVLVATLLVFAGGLMAKMSSVYGAFGETLRLFDWPYGHLVNFASLTSWVHEVWPLAAIIYLAILFVKQQDPQENA